MFLFNTLNVENSAYYKLTEFLYDFKMKEYNEDLQSHLSAKSEPVIYFRLRAFNFSELEQFQDIAISDLVYEKFARAASRHSYKNEIYAVNQMVYLITNTLNEKILLCKSTTGPVFIFDADFRRDLYIEDVSKLILLLLKKMTRYNGGIKSSCIMEAISIEVNKQDNLAAVQKIITTNQINKMDISIAEVKKIIRSLN